MPVRDDQFIGFGFLVIPEVLYSGPEPTHRAREFKLFRQGLNYRAGAWDSKRIQRLGFGIGEHITVGQGWPRFRFMYKIICTGPSWSLSPSIVGSL